VWPDLMVTSLSWAVFTCLSQCTGRHLYLYHQVKCNTVRITIFFENTSFIFIPTFPLAWVTGAAALGELEIPHSFQQSLKILLSPHSAAVAQLCPPKKNRGPLMVIYRKRFRRCATSRGRMAFKRKYPNCRHNFGGTRPI